MLVTEAGNKAQNAYYNCLNICSRLPTSLNLSFLAVNVKRET